MDRTEFFRLLESRIPAEGLLLIQKAYWFAKNVHAWQERDSGERYFEHPRTVVCTLIDRDVFEADILALGFIHDSLEDGFTPPGVILALFGPKIYRWLLVLSKKLPVFNDITGQVIAWGKRSEEEYYAAIAKADRKVQMVKLADRLHNLRTAGGWSPERKKKYVQETAQHVLPIARQADEWFLKELEAAMDILDQQIPA